MDKETHSRLLRMAMAELHMDVETLADAAGVVTRTVGNWRGGHTMPSESQLVTLRSVLGPYDEVQDDQDQVERALDASGLHKWRQHAVLATYHQNLLEQQREG